MDDAVRELIDAAEELVFAMANLLEGQYAADRFPQPHMLFQRARTNAERYRAWEQTHERWMAARRAVGDERPAREFAAPVVGSPRGAGSSRFDKFTERARKVLQLAQEEAQRFNHNYIGTEHLLLGLVREREGVAAKVLANLGVELDQARSSVEFIIGPGDRTPSGDVRLTPRAKKVIELSIDEARRFNHHYIGTEHLLLGIIREGEGIAAGVLESLGVSLDKVRNQVIYVLNQSVGGGRGESGDAGNG
jgi:hypothetical protein